MRGGSTNSATRAMMSSLTRTWNACLVDPAPGVEQRVNDRQLWCAMPDEDSGERGDEEGAAAVGEIRRPRVDVHEAPSTAVLTAAIWSAVRLNVNS